MVHNGDLFDVLPTIEADSIDACVTDPPYGLGFMGKQWDTFKPGVAETRITENRAIESDNPNLRGRKRGPASSPSAVEYDRSLEGQREFQAWTEAWARKVKRVLKPGAYLVVCGAPRSYHRMASGLEDAGFEIRDSLCWLFGQGFPKSLDVSKAIDRAAGHKRGGYVDRRNGPNTKPSTKGDKYSQGYSNTPAEPDSPATDAAKAWAGWGTALKPAYEPIVLARKPLIGTVAENVLTHGTGAVNIDACRIPSGQDHADKCASVVGLASNRNGACYGEWAGERENSHNDLGRWPANVLLDEQSAALLDSMTRDEIHGAGSERFNQRDISGEAKGMFPMHGAGGHRFGDSGGASRFFYVAKPSREERDAGIYTDEREYEHSGPRGHTANGDGTPRPRPRRNHHPTVKPVELMRWLVKLVVPPGGKCLDPFMGSGSTGMACAYEFREFIGIEREAEYVEIAKRRIAACAPLFTETDQVG